MMRLNFRKIKGFPAPRFVFLPFSKKFVQGKMYGEYLFFLSLTLLLRRHWLYV